MIKIKVFALPRTRGGAVQAARCGRRGAAAKGCLLASSVAGCPSSPPATHRAVRLRPASRPHANPAPDDHQPADQHGGQVYNPRGFCGRCAVRAVRGDLHTGSGRSGSRRSSGVLAPACCATAVASLRPALAAAHCRARRAGSLTCAGDGYQDEAGGDGGARRGADPAHLQGQAAVSAPPSDTGLSPSPRRARRNARAVACGRVAAPRADGDDSPMACRWADRDGALPLRPSAAAPTRRRSTRAVSNVSVSRPRTRAPTHPRSRPARCGYLCRPPCGGAASARHAPRSPVARSPASAAGAKIHMVLSLRGGC